MSYVVDALHAIKLIQQQYNRDCHFLTTVRTHKMNGSRNPAAMGKQLSLIYFKLTYAYF
jgi:hypothetical protein